MTSEAGTGTDGHAGSPQDGGIAVSDLGYADAARELDGIVAFFEQREVDVDQLVAKLERATAIVGELDRRLNRTRLQVEELVPRLEAVAGGRGDDQERYDDELPLEEDGALPEGGAGPARS